MPMPATSSECAPHQSRKAAECVRRMTVPITVSASFTTACDTTVDASEDGPPLPNTGRCTATRGSKGTRSSLSPASERKKSPRTRPEQCQPRRVRRRCLARRPRHRNYRQYPNRPPRQERHRWPARRPLPITGRAVTDATPLPSPSSQEKALATRIEPRSFAISRAKQAL